VLNDQSGLYADIAGTGSVWIARKAVEDFGAAAKGMKVEILSGDHQNKPDIEQRGWHREAEGLADSFLAHVRRCAPAEEILARRHEDVDDLGVLLVRPPAPAIDRTGLRPSRIRWICNRHEESVAQLFAIFCPQSSPS
jgi:hypothetical protein